MKVRERAGGLADGAVWKSGAAFGPANGAGPHPVGE